MTEAEFEATCHRYYDAEAAAMVENERSNARLLSVLTPAKRDVVLRAMDAASIALYSARLAVSRHLPGSATWDRWFRCWWGGDRHCYIKIRKGRYLRFKI